MQSGYFENLLEWQIRIGIGGVRLIQSSNGLELHR